MIKKHSSAFGAWMAQRRDQCKFASQEEAANRIGCSRASLIRWESGEGLPDLRFIPGIADAYQVEQQDVLKQMGVDMPTPAGVSDWALTLARRIDRRTSDLSKPKREAIERAIDNILTAAA